MTLALTEAERAEVVEALEDEFDLLCMGRPGPERIAEAIAWAEQRKIDAWWFSLDSSPTP